MPKITILADCSNSPKNTFIKDFNVAFANSDIHALGNMVSDDIVWEMLGDKTISGKPEFIAALKSMKDLDIVECKLETAISHGKSASASGLMVMKDGKAFAFRCLPVFVSQRRQDQTYEVVRDRNLAINKARLIYFLGNKRLAKDQLLPA